MLLIRLGLSNTARIRSACVKGIGEIAHADGEVARGSLLRGLHMAPGLGRIQKHQQIGPPWSRYSTLPVIGELRYSHVRIDSDDNDARENSTHRSWENDRFEMMPSEIVK